jgi:hypothetical protein
MLPSPEVRAEREQAALEQKLERLLAGQPGVEHAEVVLSLPRVAQVPLDQELPPARATVSVRVQDPKAELGAVSELARSALPEGTELRLIRRAGTGTGARSEQEARQGAPRTAQGVRRVGPFRVEEPSAGALRATLAGLLASNAVLAGLLLWRRARR